MKVAFLITLHRYVIVRHAFVRSVYWIVLCVALFQWDPKAEAGALQTGGTYRLTFTDVDQRELSTSDGHITIITVVTKDDEQKAQLVGDRFSQTHLADPKCRLVTLVNFQQKIVTFFRRIALAVIRHRLELEAKSLREIYSAKHIDRNPRNDLFVVADFDGKSVSQLHIEPTSGEFAVFVFDGQGRLVRRWNDAPTAESLNAAIDEAR